jgi:hypothetical protein
MGFGEIKFVYNIHFFNSVVIWNMKAYFIREPVFMFEGEALNMSIFVESHN